MSRLKQLDGPLVTGDVIRVDDEDGNGAIAVCVESDGHAEYPYCCMLLSDPAAEREELWPARYTRLFNVLGMVELVKSLGKTQVSSHKTEGLKENALDAMEGNTQVARHKAEGVKGFGKTQVSRHKAEGLKGAERVWVGKTYSREEIREMVRSLRPRPVPAMRAKRVKRT